MNKFHYFHPQLNQLDKALDKFFKLYERSNRSLTAEDISVIKMIKKSKNNLKSSDKRVVIFGVFKAGKSSFINTLIGENILPYRANRATGVITKIRYGLHQQAYAIFENPRYRKESINWDDIGKHILLNVSGKQTTSKILADRIEIEIPNSFLHNSCVLVDTPGLLDNQSLTELTYEEVEKADLAIVVLRSDKLLSESERETIRWVNELLNGNVVFILNRFDLIDKEDREDVITWTQNFLQGFGNRFVDYSRIFVLNSLVPSQEDNQDKEYYLNNLYEVKSWLSFYLNNCGTERSILITRLGVLKSNLQKASGYIQTRTHLLQEEIQVLEGEAEEDFQKRLNQFNETLTRVRNNLKIARAESSEKLIQVVNNFFKEVQNILDDNDPLWAEVVTNRWRKNCSSYIDSLKEKIRLIIYELTDDLKYHIDKFAYPPRINLAEDTATKITKNFGDSFLLGIFRSTSSFFFDEDLRQNNLYTIQKEIKASQALFNGSLEKYFQNLNSALDIYEISNKPHLIITENLSNSRHSLLFYLKLSNCITELKYTIEAYEEELSSWNSEFNLLWQIFIEQFKQLLLKQKEDKLLNTSLKYHEAINIDLKKLTNQWLKPNNYQSYWLRQFKKYHPDVGNEFHHLLQETQLTKVFNIPVKINRSELLVLIICLIFILLFIRLAPLIFLIGVLIVMKMIKERKQKHYEELEKAIIKEIDFHGSQLLNIVKKANTKA